MTIKAQLLISLICLAPLTTEAAKQNDLVLSENGLLALKVYTELGVYMDNMHAVLKQIEDHTSAEAQADSLRAACLALKEHLEHIYEPYSMSKKAVTLDDFAMLMQCRDILLQKGGAVQKELIRLAKARFYGSQALINVLLEQEMLDEETAELLTPSPAA